MTFPNRNRLASTLTAHRSLFVAAVLMISLSVWTGVGASVWYVHDAVTGLPNEIDVRTAGSMPRATTIADVKGRHAFTIFQEQRLQIPLSRVSPHLIRAIVAIEDRRFYNHGGVDPIRVAKAAAVDVVKNRAEQGGSTITQQLARLSFLNPDKTIRRKLQEVVLAARLERTFTKDEILEFYLNKAYFGDGLYGVEAASLGYFGKHASDVNIAEAALLAGLVQSPSTYAPTVNPDRAVARRNIVLVAMRRTRAIDETTYKAALRAPLRLDDGLRREEAYGRYFKEEVRKQLVQLFGWDRVYQDGLRVETTLDLDMQKAAEAEVARALGEIERRQARRGRSAAAAGDALQAAVVSIDPRTGEVRAMVGGRDFERSYFNRATQSRRQPGSAFKPFVYAAAIERGYSPATVIAGLSEPIMTASGLWLPEDEHLESDAITMRAAVRTSSNRAAVRMLQTIGIPAAVEYAEQLGVGTMPRVPSLALGAGEVTLMSLTSAFGAFANEGQLASPFLIRRVTSSEGKVLYEAKASTRPAVSPATAFLITSMLEDVVNRGTAWEARRIGFRLPAAGKTGTTNEYRDAWFVGYTPMLVTGVWIGYDKPKTIVRGGYAAELAVPLWARFMMHATRDEKPVWFRAPSSVTPVEVCRLTGRLASDACRRDPAGVVYTEYVARSNQPIDLCVLHPLETMHRVVGLPEPALATTPPFVAGRELPAPAQSIGEVRPAAEPAEPEQKKKKKGFWSRVFGIGGGEKDRKDDRKK